MDKTQKFEYVQNLETYLEEKQVFELFESLLRQIIVHKPENPYDFLMNKLQKKEPKRIFFVGPPGSNRKEIALFLAEHFSWSCISVGDLLKKEVSKKSDFGKSIAESFKQYKYVDDSIVIDLVKKQVETFERDHHSWVIEGFPRTKVQALALQKAGIIPERFIMLDVDSDSIVQKVASNMVANGTTYPKEERELIGLEAVKEYQMHIKGVKSAFQHFIIEYDATGKQQSDVANDLARMLKIRYKSNAPRRPPRVIILGPPGSGRSTQARKIAERFGLVHVCARTLLKNEIKKGTHLSPIIKQCVDEGTMVPDQYVNQIIEDRLRQTDCKVKGWIMDSFPMNETQINHLKRLKIKPSLVAMFEQPIDVSLTRLTYRRVDPETGSTYNLQLNPPQDTEVEKRLIQLAKDTELVIKTRYEVWENTIRLIEDNYKKVVLNVQTDTAREEVTEIIADAIQNPIG